MSHFVILSLWMAGLALMGQCQPEVAGCAHHPRSALWETYLDRALRLQEQRTYNEADAAYRAALGEAERLGPDHPGIANILINMGRLRTLQHEYSAARTAFERSLEIIEKRFGPDYFEVGLLLGNVAMTHHQQGHNAIAEPLYRRAIAILAKTLRQEDSRPAIFQAGLAKLLLTQRRNREAQLLFEGALPVLEKTQPPGDSGVAIVIISLAEAYRADGRYSKADPLYRRVLAMVEETPGLRTGEISLGLSHFPLMLRKMKHKTEARKLQIHIRSLLPK